MREGRKILPATAASVMMRRTSFSIWELLQSSSQVPFTSICFAKVISCFWLGTTKLITYDWSLRGTRFPWLQTSKLKTSLSVLTLPVCIGTDVVDEGAVLQDGLHLPQRHVLAGLQLHQVLFAVLVTERVDFKAGKPNAAALRRPPPFLTDDLEAAVGVKLADVAGAEPPLSPLVHEKVVADFVGGFVIAHGDVGAADEDLPSGVGLVRAVVTA